MAHVREGLNAQLRALIGISAGIPLGPGMGVPGGQDSPAASADELPCPRCGLPAEHLGQDGPASGSVPSNPVMSLV
ncbi:MULTISPECIES: hypothetical protein [unclassified Streptomyces]|uniref:hypothetical protein n=1 Tax=unclassified Streptomyces TaxID=2593676 RepID=UPI0033BE754C